MALAEPTDDRFAGMKLPDEAVFAFVAVNHNDTHAHTYLSMDMPPIEAVYMLTDVIQDLKRQIVEAVAESN